MDQPQGRRGTGRGRGRNQAIPPVGASSGSSASSAGADPNGTVPGGLGNAVDSEGKEKKVQSLEIPNGEVPNGDVPNGEVINGSRGTSPDLKLEEKMSGLEIIGLATRPGFGVVGQKTQVSANYFEVRIDKELAVVQYHIDISHERMKLTREDKHQIFWMCVRDNKSAFPNPSRILYDGDHICVCLDKLTFGSGKRDQAVGSFEVKIRLIRMEKPEIMTVKFQAVGLIHLNCRETKSASSTSDRYTTPLQVLDLILRQRRCFPLDENTANQWFSFANVVYKIPPGGRGADLTGGRVIWQGLFGAFRIGQGYSPYINFDVSHSGFYKPQSVMEYLVQVLNENFSKDRRRPDFHVEQLNGNTQLGPAWVVAFNKAIKGLKVRTKLQKQAGESVEREWTVNGVINDTSVTHRFMQRQPDGQERMISVAEYFTERYGALRYPNLSLLHVGPRNKKCYLPIEHCVLAFNQRVKKLNPMDTSIMIKAAAINAPTRKQKVDELVAQSAFSSDPWLQQFGVRVNNQMKTVEARFLQSPAIRYGGNGAGRQAPVVEVRDGVWDMRGKKFYLPASCRKIGALVLDDRDSNLYTFFNFLLRTCNELGMDVPSSLPHACIVAVPPNSINGIEEAMTRMQKGGCEFIIVTLPQKSAPHYNEVKRVSEIVLGVMTQCVVKNNIMKCMQKDDRMFTTNLAQKMNMKMGGINCSAEGDALAKKTLYEQPTLVLGIDVTHPSPMEKKMPSVSSVIANVDDSFMRYAASVRVQKHRREAIVAGHLDQLVRERLVEYHEFISEQNRKNNTNKPTQPSRLIIYRDGVSEGQFQEVLHQELGGIREACKSLDANYKPKVTVIVAQKRHHTRFFPTPGGPRSGKAENVRPGTVVDRDITHPEQFEFYLCSHFGIQGTSRPIRYNVLLDENNFSSDHVQAMTFYLCHVYARCTRTVSIPAPVYYADLACRHARAHIFDKVTDFGNDTMSTRSQSGEEIQTSISEDELIRSSTIHDGLKMRMYFT